MLYPNPPEISLPAAAGTHAATHAPTGADDLYDERGHRSATVLEPFPGWATSGNTGVTSGTVYLSAFVADVAPTVSSFIYACRGVAASGLTVGRLGLYTVNGTGAGTLVARSVSLGASTTANTETTLALDTSTGLPASYTPTRGQLYAMAVILVGTTPGNMPSGGAGMTGGMSTRGSGSFPLCGSIAAQTDLPTSFAKASIGQTGVWFYMAAV